MSKKKFTFLFSIILILFSLFLFSCLLLYPNFIESIFIPRHPLYQGKVYGILYGHGIFAPFYLFWVFIGGFHFSKFELLLLLMLVVFFICFFNIKKFQNVIFKNNFFRAILVFLFFILIYHFFSLQISPTKMFGDAAFYPSQIEKGVVFGSSALTDNLFILVRNIFSLSGLETLRFVNIAFGGFFSVIVYFLALTLGKTSFHKFLIFSGIVFSGYSIIFFAYPETTAGVLTFIAAYVLFSVKYFLFGKNSLIYLVFALISLSFACLLHNAALTMGLSLIWLIMYSPNKIVVKQIVLRFFLSFFIVLVPFVFFVVGLYYMKGNFGNATGGGDHSMFVPFYVDYLSGSLRPYYSFFSYFHFSEIISSIVLSSPMFFVVFAYFLRFRSKMNFLLNDDYPVLVFLSLLAIGTAIVPVFWHFDFGAFGDWNLVTTYFFPLNVLSFYLFVVFLRKVNEKSLLSKFSVFCFLFVQYSIVAGLLRFFEI